MQPHSPKPNEFVSQTLGPDAIRALLSNVPVIFQELGVAGVVIARYGYGSNLHPDLTYLPMKVGTTWLGRFVEDSLTQRIVVPCESDLTFEVQDGALEVEFCHHGHVHLAGNSLRLVQSAQAVSAFKDLSFTGVSTSSEA